MDPIAPGLWRWTAAHPAWRPGALVRDVVVVAGELAADELDFYTAALRAHLEPSGTLTIQPMMWQAWGRVPAAA